MPGEPGDPPVSRPDGLAQSAFDLGPPAHAAKYYIWADLFGGAHADPRVWRARRVLGHDGLQQYSPDHHRRAEPRGARGQCREPRRSRRAQHCRDTGRPARTPAEPRRMPRLDSGHTARPSAQAEAAPLRRHRPLCARRLDPPPARRRPQSRARAGSGRATPRHRDSHTHLRHRNHSAPPGRGSMKRVVLAALPAVALVAACGSKRPPPEFAPDPGLVAQIREIRVSTTPSACPGESFGATYTAVLKDGSLVPFESHYDKKHPPRLHVIFLERSSPEATPLEDGSWSAARDPLMTALTGFRLTTSLKANPSVTTSTTLTPEYSCLQHTFGFSGYGAGASGPQVTVRLGILRSPYYDRLIVAGIEVEEAPTMYVLADARAVPPSDWLVVEARGGHGSRGADGQNGVAGTNGQDGCPGGAGGPGGGGGNA